MLRELGERRRGIPPARRTIPNPALALGAITGSLTNDEVLRERYLNLLAAAMDRATAGQVHPGFLDVLRQLTPDEVRIVSTFQHDGPYPLITVSARYRFGERLSTELRHFSLLGTQAGCEHPERAPMYIDNLCRLGLTELRPVRHRRRHAHLPPAGEPRRGEGGDRARSRRDPGARERAAERRRRISRRRRRAAHGAVRDVVRPPVLRGLRIPPRARDALEVAALDESGLT